MHPPYIGLRVLTKALEPQREHSEGLKLLEQALDNRHELVIPAHVQCHVSRIEDDPYQMDTERVLSWWSGHVVVITLKREAGKPSLWSPWRSDWTPKPRDVLMFPERIAYLEPTPRLQHVLSAQGITAVSLEPSTLQLEVGLKRLSAPLEKGEHEFVFIRDDEGRAEVMPLLAAANKGNASVMILSPHAEPCRS